MLQTSYSTIKNILEYSKYLFKHLYNNKYKEIKTILFEIGFYTKTLKKSSHMTYIRH